MTDDDNRIQEQWTNSRSALVLTGSVEALTDIARALGLSDEAIIETRHGQAVLGLWGEPVETYTRLKSQGELPHHPELAT